MKENELNRPRTHRGVLPGRGSGTQEGSGRCFLDGMSMLDPGERQLYGEKPPASPS